MSSDTCLYPPRETARRGRGWSLCSAVCLGLAVGVGDGVDMDIAVSHFGREVGEAGRLCVYIHPSIRPPGLSRFPETTRSRISCPVGIYLSIYLSI